MASRWASGGSRWHALRPVEERGRAGDDQVQPGKPAGVDLVDQLPQRVERLVPDVAADPLQRLHLVEHQQQPGMARVAEHVQQPLQEAQRAEVVELAPDPGAPLGRGRDVRLAAQPGRERVGAGAVAGRHAPPGSRAAPRRRPGCARRPRPAAAPAARRPPRPARPARVRPGRDRRRVASSSSVNSQESSTGRSALGGNAAVRSALAQPAVDGLQLVQRRLGLGDLHLGGGEARAACARSASQRVKNVLPAPYSPRTALNAAPPPATASRSRVQRGREPVQPDREQVEPVGRDGAAAQRVDDLAPAPGGDVDRSRRGSRTAHAAAPRPGRRWSRPRRRAAPGSPRRSAAAGRAGRPRAA